MTSTSIHRTLQIFVRRGKTVTLRGPQSVLSGPVVPTPPVPQPPTMGSAGPDSAPIPPTPEAAKDPRNRPYGHNNAALRSEFHGRRSFLAVGGCVVRALTTVRGYVLLC